MIEPSPFETPDFEQPLDVAASLAAVPENATVRGMFFEMVNDRARRELGRPLRERVPPGLSTGSMRDYMTLLVEAAETLYPGVPIREALRRVGYTLYDDFHSTLVGRAMFAVAGRDFLRLAEVAPRAYEVSCVPCSIETRVLGPGNVRVSMKPLYIFPDSFHVGAWEGAARFCDREPTIRVARGGAPGFVELDVRFF